MLKKFKPITPGLRGTVLISKKHLSNKTYKISNKPMTSTEVEITKEKLHPEEWVVEQKENIE